MLVLHGQAVNSLHCAQLVKCSVEYLPFVNLPRADEQTHVIPRESLEFLSQIAQAARYVLCGGRPFYAQKVPIFKPQHLPAAAKRKGLEGFAQFLQRLE